MGGRLAPVEAVATRGFWCLRLLYLRLLRRGLWRCSNDGLFWRFHGGHRRLLRWQGRWRFGDSLTLSTL
jgi:hypothetical protein